MASIVQSACQYRVTIRLPRNCSAYLTFDLSDARSLSTVIKVLVTGGSGRIGRYVVRELVQSGHEVTSADLVYERLPGAQSLQVDLTEAGQAYQALAHSRATAVVHLAAWARGGQVPEARTFGDNVQGTFNVLQACADLGVRRVIFASTHHVYGVMAAPPLYVPIDEAHPLRPADAYALSKVVGERAAAYFVDRFGLEVLCFRFQGVRSPSQLDADVEHTARDPSERPHLLWTRLDARDAAVYCRLALETETVEPGPYNVAGQQVVLEQDSAELVRRYFGDQVQIREGLSGRLSPLSCARVEQAFGYRPRYNWSVNQRYPEE